MAEIIRQLFTRKNRKKKMKHPVPPGLGNSLTDKIKILIVENEALIAQDIQWRLRKMGYDTPLVVSTGAEAITKAEEYKPDLILIDIFTTGETEGIKTAEKIRLNLNIPIIYLTSSTDKATFEQAKATNPFAYLIKPFTDIELHYTIDMALHKHRTEELLFQSKQDWEDTFNTITDMITVHDRDFNIIRWNKAAEEILDLPLLKSKKVKCFEYYHGTDKPPERCPSCDCMITGEASDFELFEPHLNRFIEIRAIPRFDSENNISGVIHVVRDITRRRQMEEELLKSSKFESIGILTAGIAHDFNNLLQGILGNITYAKILLDPDDKAFEKLETAEIGYISAVKLTEQLIAFSEGTTSGRKTELLKKLIIDITKYTLNGTDIKSDLAVPEGLWQVEADEKQMALMIQNIVQNAIDAVPEGGTIKVTAENTEIDEKNSVVLNKGKYVKISIKDNGTGIPKNILPKIFDPYFSTKEKGEKKGVGLGLSICYSIIKACKGSIIVESEPETGTIVNIFLPALLTNKTYIA